MSIITLGCGKVYGTGKFQRMALLRKMRSGAEHSLLTVLWNELISTNIWMGAFVYLKCMPISLVLLVKCVGSMDVEHTAKPFKHSVLTKDRNSLSNEKGIILFRAGQNLNHLHNACQVLKGNSYAGVIGGDADGGMNEVCDELRWRVRVRV